MFLYHSMLSNVNMSQTVVIRNETRYLSYLHDNLDDNCAIIANHSDDGSSINY